VCMLHNSNHFTYILIMISIRGLSRCRWVDTIKMDLRDLGWVGMDWIDLAQDRDQWRAHVNTLMNLRVP
jgi:hypothetical protein